MRRHGWRPAYAVSVALVLIFASWLRWPTLENGFFSDDFVAAAMIEGEYAAPRHELDLFNFTDGRPEDYEQLTRVGSLPWWTVPGLRLAMLRPLSSVLVLIDTALFGDDAWAYHLHSMLWWLGAMLVAAVLFRKLFTAPFAVCALAIFAVEQGHTLPIGWLANRGTLVAIVFCLAGLMAQVRYRTHGSRGAAWLAFGCFSIALASGEWAFPLLGYALGYALAGDDGPWRQRLLALWTAAIPGVVFLVVRSALGYGAQNSGVYTDPLTEPARFAYMALHRIPVFMADLTFAIPSNWWGYNTPWRDMVLSWDLFPPRVWLRLPDWRTWHVVLGVLAIALFLWALRSSMRLRPESERRPLLWLSVGGLLSLIPVVSSFPTSRLVVPAALAVAAVATALLLSATNRLRDAWTAQRVRLLFARSTAASSWVNLLAIGAVLYFQLWRPAERSYDEARWTRGSYEAIRWFVRNTPFDDARIAEQTVVVLSAVDHSSTIFLPYLRWALGHPKPKATLTLTAAPHPHDIYRPASNVLELVVLGGTLMSSEFEELYRAPRFRFREGQRIDIGPMQIEILRLIEGKPQWVRFTFDHDLDDPSYVFLYATVEGYVRVPPLEIGERKRFRLAGHPSDVAFHERVRGGRDPNVRCLGLQPPLDDCRVGLFWADCGGSEGKPVLGCRFDNDCRWFLRGCVAANYEPSSCEPEHACCIENPKRGSRGAWPFPAESFMTDDRFATPLAENLQGWGKTGWDVERHLRIPVTLDPTRTPRVPKLSCEGVSGDEGPCDAGLLDLAKPNSRSLSFVFRSPRARPTWALAVEIVDTRAGDLVARVCRVGVPLADVDGECGEDREPDCAIDGAISLAAFPFEWSHFPGLNGQLRARFEDGAQIDAEF